jgi:hypothetical protein
MFLFLQNQTTTIGPRYPHFSMENRQTILQPKNYNEKPDASELWVCVLDTKTTTRSHQASAVVVECNETVSITIALSCLTIRISR